MAAALRLFSFSGSATRLQALAVLLAYFIGVVAWIILSREAPLHVRYLALPLQLAAWAMLATSARRLHHAGQSGLWAALTLVPFLGLVAALAIALMSQRKLHLRPHNGARMAGYGAMAVLMLIAFLRLWWTPFWIPSESMKPALLEGDYIVVRHGLPVHRGDALVFLHPVTREALAKRVVALAGDRVAMSGGQVFVNGAGLVQLPQGDFIEVMGPKGPDQLRPRCREGVVGDGAVCSKEILTEVQTGGRSYDIANIENGAADTFAEVVVPAGALFLLGDNRDNSLDSRFATAVGGLGFVPAGNVMGHVRRVMFSAEGAGLWAVWTWRAGRYLAGVN